MQIQGWLRFSSWSGGSQTPPGAKFVQPLIRAQWIQEPYSLDEVSYRRNFGINALIASLYHQFDGQTLVYKSAKRNSVFPEIKIDFTLNQLPAAYLQTDPTQTPGRFGVDTPATYFEYGPPEVQAAFIRYLNPKSSSVKGQPKQYFVHENPAADRYYTEIIEPKMSGFFKTLFSTLFLSASNQGKQEEITSILRGRR